MKQPLFRWPWSASLPLASTEAAEQVAEACLRAKSPATPAEYAARMAELRQHLAERARFPVRGRTEAPDAE